MKSIAIVFEGFKKGGTSSSLLSFLNSINLNQYSVTLILESFYALPKIDSRIQIKYVGYKKINILKKMIFSIVTFKIFCLLLDCFKNRHNFVARFKMGLVQIGGMYRAKKSYFDKNHYDIAVGFAEFFADEYVCLMENVEKKVVWIHPDYESSNMSLLLDKKKFKIASKIVFVSKNISQRFNYLTDFRYNNKITFMENIIDTDKIRALSNNFVQIDYAQSQKIKLVTVCRLVKNKGLERMIEVANLIKKYNLNICWNVVGGGGHEDYFKQMISDNNLENIFNLYGEQNNPYPFIKASDIFVLLTHYEGKPISVSEALALNVPCVVTDYISAREQILEGINGYICSNANFDPEEVLFKIKKCSQIKKESVKIVSLNSDINEFFNHL